LKAASANNKPPIIVIGMHRAGTSMLTRLLGAAGVFLGRSLTRNAECRFMNSLNYWVFEQSSASWEKPCGVDSLLEHAGIRPLVTDYLTGVTDGPASIRYLGLQRWLRYRSMHNVTEQWGWKDPRNTYTLPLWLHVFPSARVIHITRHGVDVAESLRLRHQLAFRAAAARYSQRRWLYVNNPLAPKRSGFAHAPSVSALDYGLRLWRDYTHRARVHVQALGHQALELRYEDFLETPETHVKAVLGFCDIALEDERVGSIVADVRPSRRYAYQHSDELAAFAARRSDILQGLGYQA